MSVMNIEFYETVRYAIRLTPLITLLIFWFYSLRFRALKRTILMFFFGWALVALSTYCFWQFSFYFAPTTTIQETVALKDGAPKVAGILFGWVFGLLIFSCFEGFRVVYVTFKNLRRNLHSRNT